MSSRYTIIACKLTAVPRMLTAIISHVSAVQLSKVNFESLWSWKFLWSCKVSCWYWKSHGFYISAWVGSHTEPESLETSITIVTAYRSLLLPNVMYCYQNYSMTYVSSNRHTKLFLSYWWSQCDLSSRIPDVILLTISETWVSFSHTY